jgi:tRNA modification GTPase
MYSSDEQTIIAQCTPKGSGAIALVRLSGARAVEIADSIAKLPASKRLKDQVSHTVHYGWVKDQQEAIVDQVLFTIMLAPRTFTGENIVEISCHNNPFIIESIIQEAIKMGARLAQQGEFTRRAVGHGKIDLIQAEAINELIHAQTQRTLQQSLAQLDGTLSQWIYDIEQELLKALAWCDASFEFLDDERDFSSDILCRIREVERRISVAKKNFNAQQQIRQGVRIALLGAVNAGKSSLFNVLLGHERSIVTSIAGTTRDSIEAGLYRDGNYLTLIDTAGLRTTENCIEREGIKRSWEEAHRADIVILVIDNSRCWLEDERQVYEEIIDKYGSKVILVYNKTDLPSYRQEILQGSETISSRLSVSCLTSYNAQALEQTLQEKVVTIFERLESPFLLNQRHYQILLAVENNLQSLSGMLTGSAHYELISYHLRESLEQLSELTGKSITEAGLDMVFKEFCVGK